MTEGFDCVEGACLACFRSAAFEISKAIARSNKPTSALGRDGVSIASAFTNGVEVGNEAFGGRSTSVIDSQKWICKCSFGPFPVEVSGLPDLKWTKSEQSRMKLTCANFAGLSRSYCGAKKRRGRTPSAWHSAFEISLKIASSHCIGIQGCTEQIVEWRSNPQILEELATRGFKF